MTSLATFTSKMIFDLIHKKLKKLVNEGVIYSSVVSNYPYDKITINIENSNNTIAFAKDIIILFYRDTGRMSVQLWGAWLLDCIKLDRRIKRFVTIDGEFQQDESFWNLSGDPEEVSNLIIKKLQEEIFPMHWEGQFKKCFNCPFQLECLATKQNFL